MGNGEKMTVNDACDRMIVKSVSRENQDLAAVPVVHLSTTSLLTTFLLTFH